MLYYATFAVVSVLCAFSLLLVYRAIKYGLSRVVELYARDDSYIRGETELKKPWGW